MNQGWIKLHRRIRENPFYRNPAALSVWIECLLRASHEKREVYSKREKLIIDSGQFLMGRDEFGSSIGISGSTAWYWLLQFEADSMVDIKKTSKGSIVSLKNWVEYQVVDSEVDNKKTADEQPMNTNKNYKNYKNYKNTHVANATTQIKTFSEIDKNHASLLVEYVRQHNPAFNQKLGVGKEFRGLDKWTEDIEKMKRIDKIEDKQIEFVIRWLATSASESASFWRKNVLSASTLRKQWQKLVAAIKYEHEKASRPSSKVGIIL